MDNNNNGYPSSTRAWVTVAILMLAYVLSFVDRQILNLLVEPIRRDLDITDTHMSLLMGFSFAVFYTICGVPIGRLADRKSRRGIIAVGVLVWSLMTALCGTARTFWQFLVFRIGVGVGEAALSPSAYSLIADSFPPKLRGTAMSVTRWVSTLARAWPSCSAVWWSNSPRPRAMCSCRSSAWFARGS